MTDHPTTFTSRNVKERRMAAGDLTIAAKSGPLTLTTDLSPDGVAYFQIRDLDTQEFLLVTWSKALAVDVFASMVNTRYTARHS